MDNTEIYSILHLKVKTKLFSGLVVLGRHAFLSVSEEVDVRG